MSKFGEAFAKARKGGAKEFAFGGKKYNTKMKGEGDSSKKKSSLPSTAKVGPSKPMMQKNPNMNAQFSADAMSRSPKVPAKKTTSAVKPFMKDTSTLNDFKQKEARRSSDEKTGAANAPKVKKAIGKFMLGKGYKG